jgi:hypothetical protein
MLTFDLRIPVTADTAASIKRDVANSLRGIKSSHLSEAIARGVGFNTHASLRAAVDAGENSRRPVSGSLFAEFLRDRGHQVGAKPLYLAAARAAIRNVMETHPRLSRWGYGVGRPKRKPEGKWENAHEHYARFLSEREELLSHGAAEEFLRSLVLVQLIAPIKTFNRRSGSYRLKHRAENLTCTYPDGTTLGPAYVTNGSLIVAAVYAGFTYKTFLDDLGYEHVNVAFNMAQTSHDDALYRFLGSRGLTEERKQRAARRLIAHGAVVRDQQATSIT